MTDVLTTCLIILGFVVWPLSLAALLLFNLKGVANVYVEVGPFHFRRLWSVLFKVFVIGGFIASLFCCSTCGEIARGEASPFPWREFHRGLVSTGILEGLLCLGQNLLFLL